MDQCGDTDRNAAPIIRYTRTGDGVALAYTKVGGGPIPLVVAAPLIGQLEIPWEEPAFEQFMTRLTVGTRVMLFDRRGSGCRTGRAASPTSWPCPTCGRCDVCPRRMPGRSGCRVIAGDGTRLLDGMANLTHLEAAGTVAFDSGVVVHVCSPR